MTEPDPITGEERVLTHSGDCPENVLNDYADRPLRVTPLRRLEWIGHARYETRDGRFQIHQGGNGAGSWTIYPEDAACQRALVVSDTYQAFNRLRDARDWLEHSVYDWLRNHGDEIDAEYERLMRGAFNA